MLHRVQVEAEGLVETLLGRATLSTACRPTRRSQTPDHHVDGIPISTKRYIMIDRALARR